MNNLVREAWNLYYNLDHARMVEAQYQAAQPIKSADRLLRLVRLCKLSYKRFERRAVRFY